MSSALWASVLVSSPYCERLFSRRVCATGPTRAGQGRRIGIMRGPAAEHHVTFKHHLSPEGFTGKKVRPQVETAQASFAPAFVTHGTIARPGVADNAHHWSNLGGLRLESHVEPRGVGRIRMHDRVPPPPPWGRAGSFSESPPPEN